MLDVFPHLDLIYYTYDKHYGFFLLKNLNDVCIVGYSIFCIPNFIAIKVSY